MRHLRGISTTRLPARAQNPPLTNDFTVCFQYLLNTGDFWGFSRCVNCKLDPKCD